MLLADATGFLCTLLTLFVDSLNFPHLLFKSPLLPFFSFCFIWNSDGRFGWSKKSALFHSPPLHIPFIHTRLHSIFPFFFPTVAAAMSWKKNRRLCQKGGILHKPRRKSSTLHFFRALHPPQHMRIFWAVENNFLVLLKKLFNFWNQSMISVGTLHS